MYLRFIINIAYNCVRQGKNFENRLYWLKFTAKTKRGGLSWVYAVFFMTYNYKAAPDALHIPLLETS